MNGRNTGTSAGVGESEMSNLMSLAQHIARNMDSSISWRDIEWARSIWKGPIVLKGILSPEDARKKFSPPEGFEIRLFADGGRRDQRTDELRALADGWEDLSGLDIGAKEDVYEMVRDMCDDGVGILLVADTFEEAIGLAHTIIVIKDGRMQKRFDYNGTAKPTPYDLLHAMV